MSKDHSSQPNIEDDEVCNRSGNRPFGEVRGCHFRQWSEREAGCTLAQCRTCPRPRRFEGQSIPDVLLHSPELFPPSDSLIAALFEFDELVPGRRLTETVDDPDQLVGVRVFDGLEGTGPDAH